MREDNPVILAVALVSLPIVIMLCLVCRLFPSLAIEIFGDKRQREQEVIKINKLLEDGYIPVFDAEGGFTLRRNGQK